jgi:hypothetical protein
MTYALWRRLQSNKTPLKDYGGHHNFLALMNYIILSGLIREKLFNFLEIYCNQYSINIKKHG